MAIRQRGKSLQIDVQVTRGGHVVRHREAFRGSRDEALEREAAIKAALEAGATPGRLMSAAETASARKDAWRTNAKQLAANPEAWPVGGANSPARRAASVQAPRSPVRRGRSKPDQQGRPWPFASIRYSQERGLTLVEALEECYERRWKGAGNVVTMLSAIERLLAFYGAHTPLGDIETEDVDAYITAMKAAGLSPQTIRQRLSPLSVAFNDFVGTRKGEGIVRPKFRFPRKLERLRIRTLSDHERREIIRLLRHEFDEASRRRPEDMPDGCDWADLMTFLMDTGVRPSEARALRGTDRFGDRVRVWKTKSGKPRIIPLTQRAEEAFIRRAMRTEPGSDEPFGWATKERIAWVWRWVRSAMGLEDDPEFIPYVLRHDCATRLYAGTRDLLLVKEWMGHSTIDMTLRYAKLDPARLNEARDVLSGAVGHQHLRPA
jgi:integrase